MLVMLLKEQLVSPSAVCKDCLLASQSGQPRWDHAGLRCGRLLPEMGGDQPAQYECQMGFRIAKID